MSTATLRLSANEYRWSLAVRCPRLATLKRRGTPETEVTERQRRIRRRGQLFEDLVAEQFQAKYGTEGVQRQREVMWPGGVLHPDLFIVEERAAIEVKSSTHPSSLIADARLQNAGQQRFDPDCQAGGLVFVDPVDLEETYVPVDPDDHRDEIDQILEQLAWAENTGGLPDCTAKSPTHCRHGKFCPFTDTAWEGWTPPMPGRIDDPYVLEIVAELHGLASTRRMHERIARSREDREKELKAILAEFDLLAGAEYQVGPLKVKRITVAEAQVAYTRKAYDRWQIDLDGEEPLPTPDYGDVPF